MGVPMGPVVLAKGKAAGAAAALAATAATSTEAIPNAIRWFDHIRTRKRIDGIHMKISVDLWWSERESEGG